MKQSRRRLPHVYPEGKPLFLTWHLHGSLPHALYPPPAELSSGKAFVWIDRYLDTTRTGPAFLARPAVAQIIVEGIERGERELRHYDLHAFVVMPNHVHLLLTPCVDLGRFLQSLKGFTAREANKLLRRTGEPFWQHESYDHWVRNGRELERIRAYVEENPVKAGLASRPEDFPWSSAARCGASS